LVPSNARCRQVSGCFLPDVLITMADGSKKAISQLKVGDLVRGKNSTNRVMATTNYDMATRLYSFNGGKAFVTGGHPFWTRDGWKAIEPQLTAVERHGVETGQLKVGDELLLEDGSRFVITRIETDGTLVERHVRSEEHTSE